MAGDPGLPVGGMSLVTMLCSRRGSDGQNLGCGDTCRDLCIHNFYPAPKLLQPENTDSLSLQNRAFFSNCGDLNAQRAPLNLAVRVSFTQQPSTKQTNVENQEYRLGLRESSSPG